MQRAREQSSAKGLVAAKSKGALKKATADSRKEYDAANVKIDQHNPDSMSDNGMLVPVRYSKQAALQYTIDVRRTAHGPQ